MPAGTLLSLALLLLTTLPGLAGAATIHVSWTATVDFVAPELASAVAIGDPASGSFLIDTAVADANPDPTSGSYPGAATAITFSFGSHGIGASSGNVHIANTLGDGFSVLVQFLGGSVEGIPVEYFVFNLETGPGAWSSDAIPPSIDFAQFHGGAVIAMGFLGPPLLGGATASSFSYVVPEPATGTLLGLGMLTLGSLRRSR